MSNANNEDNKIVSNEIDKDLESAEAEEVDSYELAFIVAEKDDENLVKNQLQMCGAKVSFHREPQKIVLAYPIKKQTAGYFGFCDFVLDKSRVADLNRELSLAKQILRFLIVKYPKDDVRPSRAAAKLSNEKVAGLVIDGQKDILTNEALEARLQEILQEH